MVRNWIEIFRNFCLFYFRMLVDVGGQVELDNADSVCSTKENQLALVRLPLGHVDLVMVHASNDLECCLFAVELNFATCWVYIELLSRNLLWAALPDDVERVRRCSRR